MSISAEYAVALPEEDSCRHPVDPVAPPGPDGSHYSMPDISQIQVLGPLSGGKCFICCLDEHTAFQCPYDSVVPKNAIVGRGCSIVCKVCDRLFSGSCCKKDTGCLKVKIGDPPGDLSAFAATRAPFSRLKFKKKINVGQSGFASAV